MQTVADVATEPNRTKALKALEAFEEIINRTLEKHRARLAEEGVKATVVETANPVKQDETSETKTIEESGEARINDTLAVGLDEQHHYLTTIQARSMNRGREHNTKDQNYYIVNGADAVAWLAASYTVDAQGVMHTFPGGSVIQRSYDLQMSEPGTKIRFVVDEARDAELATTNPTDKEYIASRPIAIEILKNDKWVPTDTWLHTRDWIDSNVAPIIFIDGEPIDNRAIQLKRIDKLREYIHNQLKAGKEVTGEVSRVTAGKMQKIVKHEMKNGVNTPVIDAKTKKPAIGRLPVKQALPGVTAFGIMENGRVKVKPTEVLDLGYSVEGLPDGLLVGVFTYNGKPEIVPISSIPIGSMSLINTSIIQAFDIALSKEVDPKYNFLQTYPDLVDYVDNFINVRTRIKLNNKNAKTKGIFGYDAKGNLAFGIDDAGMYYNMHPSPDGVTFTKSAENSKPIDITKEAYLKALEETLKVTSLSVKLNRINTPGGVEIPLINKAGAVLKAQSENYTNYNDWVASNLTTNIEGRTKLPNGEYTPYIQPTVYFDMDGVDTAIGADDTTKPDDKAIAAVAKKKDVPSFSIAGASTPINYESANIDVTYNYLNDVFDSREEQRHVVGTIVKFVTTNIFSNTTSVNNRNIKENMVAVKRSISNVRAFVDEYINNKSKLDEAELAYLAQLGVVDSNTALLTREYYDKIINNYHNLAPYIYETFREIGLLGTKDFQALIEANENLIAEDELTDSDVSIYEKIQYNKDLDFRTDPKDYSGEFRLMLATLNDIAIVDGKPVTKKSNLGFAVAPVIDELYENLMMDLSGKTKTLEGAIDILNTKLQVRPIYKQIIDKLKDTKVGQDANFNESFKTLFINNLFQAKADLVKTIAYPEFRTNFNGDYEQVGYAIHNIELTALGGYKGVINSWSESQKRAPFMYMADKKLKINVGAVQQIFKDFTKIYNKEVIKYDQQKAADVEITAFLNDQYLENVVAMLGQLGIQTDVQSFKDFAFKSKAYKQSDLNWMHTNTVPIYDSTIINGFFGELVNSMTSDTIANTPFTDSSFNYDSQLYNRYITKLAKATYANNNVLYSLSSLDSNNNIIYTIQKYNRQSSLLRQIKAADQQLLKDLASVSISKYSPLVNSLISDQTLLDSLKLEYFDNAVWARGKDTSDIVVARNTTANTQNIIGLNLFINRGQREMKMLGLTPGDSHKSPVFTLPRVKFKVTRSADGVKVTDSVVDHFYNYLRGEIERIHKYNDMAKKPNSKQYNDGAGRFILNGWLDVQNLSPRVGNLNEGALLTEAEYKSIYTGNLLRRDTKANTTIRTVLRRYLNELVANSYSDFVSQGTIINNNVLTANNVDYRYVQDTMARLRQEGVPSTNTLGAALQEIIADYTLNTYAFSVEQKLLIVVDPAHFTIMDGNNVNYYKTDEAVQKRLKSSISPTITGNHKDNHYSRIIINDIKLDSINKELVAKGYKGMTTTDGFEWLRDVEYIKQLKAYNIITQSEYENAIEKIEHAWAKNNGEYTLAEIGITEAQILKPMSFTHTLSNEFDTMFPDLTKSSFMGLFPEFTKQAPELDAHR